MLIFCLFQKIPGKLFFFCSRKSSLAIHSFDFETAFFFPGAGKKKNIIFIQPFDFPLKVHKNELFREKKYDTFVLSYRFHSENL